MSYYKQFIAASAALAAETIRSAESIPSPVRALAAGDIARLRESPGYALMVELSGHSPSGTAPFEQASMKLETRWVQVIGLEAPPAPVPDEQPTERIVQAARPIEPSEDDGA